MKILMIAYYTLLRHVRDYKAVLIFSLFPLVMILILGNALNSEFTPQSIESMKVGYVSEDTDGVLETSLETFLQDEEVTSLLQVEKLTQLEDGKERVRTGELEGLIYLSKNQSEKLTAENEAHIQLYTMEENSFIQPVLESFVRSLNLNQVLLQIGGVPSETTEIISPMEEVEIITEGRIPRGIDYYAIASLLQSLLFGAMFGVFAITKDLGNHTCVRTLAAPISHIQMLVGKLLGSLLVLYGIALFNIVVAKFVFGANIGNNPGLVLLVLLLFCTIAISIGMSLGLLTKSIMASSLILFVISTVMTLVSGGFSRMEGDVMELLSRFAPNSYTQNVLFTSIYEGTIVHSALIGLAVYTGISIFVTFIAGRRNIV